MPTHLIHKLAQRGDIAGVLALLAESPELANLRNSGGESALAVSLLQREASAEMVRLLLEAGSDPNLQWNEQPWAKHSVLQQALRQGDPEVVAALVDHGARFDYKTPSTVMFDAAVGRNISRDPKLLALIQLLLDYEIDPDDVTSYGENALSQLASCGRFDAGRLLVDRGANTEVLGWTPLHWQAAYGNPESIRVACAQGADLEAGDKEKNTPFLLAVLAGKIANAEALLELGANANVKAESGATALHRAVEAGQTLMLSWLIAQGLPIDEPKEDGVTALKVAVDLEDLELIDCLLEAGATLDDRRGDSVMYWATNSEVVLRLLAAGAPARDLSCEAARNLIGLETDELASNAVTHEEYERGRSPRFGTSNPEEVVEPLWQGMVQSGFHAFCVGRRYGEKRSYERGKPNWSADRFGQSLTMLPDGRKIQVAGEHEDFYDPDFCIYNDVFVHEPDGRIRIFLYPRSVFQPTDFHTATVVGDWIYIIGNAGYPRDRSIGGCPVYRLNLNCYAIEAVATQGDDPGWIHGHVARLFDGYRIQVFGQREYVEDCSDSEGGKCCRRKRRNSTDSPYVFDTRTNLWSRE